MELTREPPRVKVAQRGEDGLSELGSPYQQRRPHRLREGPQARDIVDELIHGREERGVQRRPKLVSPFLHGVRISSATGAILKDGTHPGDVRSAVGTKGGGPGGLEGLEVLVGLEEGPDQRGVDETEEQQRGEDVARPGGGHGAGRGGSGAGE